VKNFLIDMLDMADHCFIGHRWNWLCGFILRARYGELVDLIVEQARVMSSEESK